MARRRVLENTACLLLVPFSGIVACQATSGGIQKNIKRDTATFPA